MNPATWFILSQTGRTTSAWNTTPGSMGPPGSRAWSLHACLVTQTARPPCPRDPLSALERGLSRQKTTPLPAPQSRATIGRVRHNAGQGPELRAGALLGASLQAGRSVWHSQASPQPVVWFGCPDAGPSPKMQAAPHTDGAAPPRVQSVERLAATATCG